MKVELYIEEAECPLCKGKLLHDSARHEVCCTAVGNYRCECVDCKATGHISCWEHGDDIHYCCWEKK